jgi:hypothetical protein
MHQSIRRNVSELTRTMTQAVPATMLAAMLLHMGWP